VGFATAKIIREALGIIAKDIFLSKHFARKFKPLHRTCLSEVGKNTLKLSESIKVFVA